MVESVAFAVYVSRYDFDKNQSLDEIAVDLPIQLWWEISRQGDNCKWYISTMPRLQSSGVAGGARAAPVTGW